MISNNLYVAWVHEDPDSSSHGLGRQIGLELGSDNTTVTVRSDDLSPNATKVRSVLLHFGLVDVRHSLAASGLLLGC